MAASKEKDKPGKSFLDKINDTIRGGGKTKERSRLTPSQDGNSYGNAGGDANRLNVDYETYGRVSPVVVTTPTFDDAPALTDDEVEKKFEKFIEDLNLQGEKGAPLRAKTIEEKRKMLAQMNRSTQSERGGKVKSDLPSDYIRLLSDHFESNTKLLKVLESLRVAIANNPISWVESFGMDGLDLILYHLNNLSESVNKGGSSSAIPAQFECIRCLRAFMNNRCGFLKMVEHPKSCKYLVKSLNVVNPSCMTETVKMLAAMCVFSEGGEYICFRKVLEGFTTVGETEERARFLPIIWGLLEQGDAQLQVASLQLINALLNGSEEVELRIRLRSELMRTGMRDVFEDLEKNDDEPLTIQVKIFNRDREHDFQTFELQSEICGDFDSLPECFQLLQNSVLDTPSEIHLLEIAQDLLLIPEDDGRKNAYLALIAECVSQIVFYKDGCDPDFRPNKRISLDVDSIIDKIVENGSVYEGDGAVSKGIGKKLDAALIDCQEMDAKLRQIYSKIDEYQTEVTELRTHITSNGQTPLPPTTVAPAAYVPKKLHIDHLVPETSSTIPPPPPLGPGIPPPPPPPPPPPGSGIPPPPPPPPGSGIPPPPPPPPPIGGGPPPPPPPPGGMRFPGPPPPPGGLPGMVVETLPPYLQPKKKFNPDVKLKKLNWRAITPMKISENSFWTKTKEGDLASPELLKEINDLFAIAGPKPKDSSDEGDGEMAAGKARDQKTIKSQKQKGKTPKVLDSTSILPVAILQSSLKMSNDECVRAILELDESKLSDSTLQQLIQALPEADVVARLNEYKDKWDELADAEQFLAKICSVKRLKPRLQLICFKMRFDEMINDVKPEIVVVTAACDEVRNSQGFKKFLELLLLVGNYLNSGSKNSGVFAFDISYLPKLSDTKSVNSSRTLLHFLVEIMETKHSRLADFTNDFIHVQGASRVSAAVLVKNFELLKKTVKQLEGDLKTFVPQDEHDRFKEVMEPFYGQAKEACDLLDNMESNMRTKYDDLGKYFAFDSKKYGSDEMFNDLLKFKEQYEHARRDLAKLRDQEEKERRTKEFKQQADKEKLERQERQKKLAKTINPNAETGVMDSLLEALNSGIAYPQRTTPNKGTPRSGGRRSGVSRQRSRVYPESQRPAFAVASSNQQQQSDSAASSTTNQNAPQMKVRRKGQSAQVINGGDGRSGGGGDALAKDVDDLLSRLKNM